MSLFLSILLATLLSIGLFMIAPIIAAIVLSGIALGCLIRGLYLVYEIHEKIVPKEDKVKAAIKRHIEERELIK